VVERERKMEHGKQELGKRAPLILPSTATPFTPVDETVAQVEAG